MGSGCRGWQGPQVFALPQVRSRPLESPKWDRARLKRRPLGVAIPALGGKHNVYIKSPAIVCCLSRERADAAVTCAVSSFSTKGDLPRSCGHFESS